MRTIVAASVVALVVAVPGLAGIMGPASKDVTVLIPQATKMVRAKPGFSKAVLLEADGTPLSGKVTTAAGIKKWRFVYNNQGTKGFKFASAALYYKNGKFTSFVKHEDPFVEDKNISAVPKMTLTTAIAKLRAAGHKQPFGDVTLRWPIRGWSEPLYIFGIGAKFWAVGTKTGKVKPI